MKEKEANTNRLSSWHWKSTPKKGKANKLVSKHKARVFTRKQDVRVHNESEEGEHINKKD